MFYVQLEKNGLFDIYWTIDWSIFKLTWGEQT